jgi:polar amino acid transport system substrate-binding protein
MKLKTGRQFARQLTALGLFFTVLFSGCGGAGGASTTGATDSQAQTVLKRGTIRAGYVTYPPGLIKDPNSGKLSGIFVETVERAAAALSLKVEWVEEVGWGTMIEGLRAGRYDIIGSPVWANSSRAREADFSVPLFYSGIGVYVRADDHRFDKDIQEINQASTKIAAIDGEMSTILASTLFPRATVAGLPQLTDNSRILLDVATGRADVTFVEPYIAGLFLQTNAGKVRNVVPERPIRIFPNTVMLRQGEPTFKAMLNAALEEQINMGTIDELFLKYKVPTGSFYRVALPYRGQ